MEQTHAVPLPPADHYQYFSHLWHSGQLVPWRRYRPDPGWQYPDHDRQRFTRLFQGWQVYVQGHRCLDLGCHTGFISLVALGLGATAVRAVNSRPQPLAVGRYALEELGVTGVELIQQDIEDTRALQALCDQADTVIMAQALEHMANPLAVLEAISRSRAQHLLFQSTLSSDTGMPQLTYHVQSTSSAFNAWRGDREQAWAAVPNLRWIETVLYSLGWSLELHRVDRDFDRNWFATPGLDRFPPRTGRSVTLAASRRGHGRGTEHWQ